MIILVHLFILVDNLEATPITSFDITHLLLNNFQQQWNTTELPCRLKFIFTINQKVAKIHEASQALDFVALSNFFQPYQLHFPSIHTSGNDYSFKGRSDPPKHRANCWTVVVALNLNSVAYLERETFGDTIYDNFVFLAWNSSDNLLVAFQEGSKAITKYAHKYGIIYSQNFSQVQYLMEPEIFTGNFVSTSHLTFQPKLNNLNGRRLTISTLIIPPLVIKQDGKYYRGMYYDLLFEVSRCANFTFDIRSEKFPGTEQANGTWTGLIGLLKYKKVDIVLYLGIALYRFPHVLYTTGNYHEDVVFFVREPDALLQWHALMYPLQASVWLFTGLLLVALLMLSTFMSYIELNGNIRGNGHVLMEAVLSPYAVILEQPARTTKKGKATLVLCILLGFFIGIAYKCNLVSFLTFPEKPSFPRTFYGLSIHKDFSLTLYSLQGIETKFFKTATNPLVKSIADRLSYEPDPGKCLEAVLKPKSVCMGWKNMITIGFAKRSAGNKKYKNLYTAITPLSTEVASLVPRGSIFYEVLSRYSGYARVSGLMEQWRVQYFQEEELLAYNEMMERKKIRGDNQDQEISEDIPEHIPLTLGNLVAVGIVFIFGCGLSAICFLFEKLPSVAPFLTNLGRIETEDINLIDMNYIDFNYGKRKRLL